MPKSSKELVIVPLSFKKWYEEIERAKGNGGYTAETAKKFAMWKISEFGFGCPLKDINGKEVNYYDRELTEWVSDNWEKAARAILDGFQVESSYWIVSAVNEEGYSIYVEDFSWNGAEGVLEVESVTLFQEFVLQLKDVNLAKSLLNPLVRAGYTNPEVIEVKINE